MLWRLNKITCFKYGIVPGNNECNLSSFIMDNVIFIIQLRFSVDPSLLISRSSISLLIWLKPLLKFGIIIRSRQMGQLRLREFTWWSPKSDRSGRGPQTSYFDFKFQGSWCGHAVMFIANSCALVLENVGKKKENLLHIKMLLNICLDLPITSRNVFPKAPQFSGCLFKTT